MHIIFMKQDGTMNGMERFTKWLTDREYEWFQENDQKKHKGKGTLREIRFFEYCCKKEMSEQVIGDLLSFEPLEKYNKAPDIANKKRGGAHRMLRLLSKFLPVKPLDRKKQRNRMTPTEMNKHKLRGKVYIFGTMDDYVDKGGSEHI